MNKTKQQLQLARAIMRRVYYAYSLSIVLTPVALWGFVFGASVIGFWKLVSVMSIINNLLNVRVGDVPNHALASFANTETITQMAFAIIVFTILSIGIRISRPELRFGRQLQSV